MNRLATFDGTIPKEIPVDTEPLRCIQCGEDSFTGSPLDSSYNSVWRDMECDNCGTAWTEVYTISHLENITIGDK
jgi:hypothetical protein